MANGCVPDRENSEGLGTPTAQLWTSQDLARRLFRMLQYH
jgi:hypothetical protein